MPEAFAVITGYSVLLINSIALVAIVYGSIEASFGAIRAMFGASADIEPRGVWLRYARWLIGALTFQLAADIIETSITPDWQDIGRLAAIALIRTFLNYFLERDLAEARATQPEQSIDHA